MRLTLFAKSTWDRDNLAPTAERLINLYAYPAPEGALAPLVARAVPQTTEWVTLPGPFLRAVARVEERLYALCAGALYRIEENGSFALLAPIPDDTRSAMVGHRDAVTITADGKYYLWEDDDLSQPGSGRLEDIGSVAFLDQFTVLSERGGRELEWTEAGLPDDRNGLYFATAEARDDKIVRVMGSGAYLAVLKEHSTETWMTTNQGGSRAFVRAQGSVVDKGVRDFNLITVTPDAVFWVGEDNVARLGGGIVSPPNVNQALERGTPTHCFYYEDRGHMFHVIRFADRPAWVYDSSTGFWHERSEGSDHGPWNVIAAVKCYGRWLLCDQSGRIMRLSNVPTGMRRTIVGRPLYSEGKPFSTSLMEVCGLYGTYSVTETGPNALTDEWGTMLGDEDGEVLVADETGSGTWERPGRLWARISRDGGHTYGLPKVKPIGQRGQYTARARWRALGQFQTSMTAEINITDPVDVPLLSEANVEVS